MKIWDVVRSVYAKVDTILQCAAVYAGTSALDIISSLHMAAGTEESNPFARHPDGSFWLKHALITEGVNVAELACMSASCYVGARILGEKWARFAAGVPWIYFGFLHLDGAFNNVLYEIPSLYVQTYHDILQKLLGL